MVNEAHDATDYWDADIHNSAGQTECVGSADRAAYDLYVHSARNGHLVARTAWAEPLVTEKLVLEFDKKTVGKTFTKDAGAIQKVVGEMTEELPAKLQGAGVSPSL